jgi:hypothetical protein
MTEMKLLGEIFPQPPKGINYMLGGEPWLLPHHRGLFRLHCEEWGNLGPMELEPEIKRNKAGFRVRCTTFIAPAGVFGYTQKDGVYYWTDMDVWDQMAAARAQEAK